MNLSCMLYSIDEIVVLELAGQMATCIAALGKMHISEIILLMAYMSKLDL